MPAQPQSDLLRRLLPRAAGKPDPEFLRHHLAGRHQRERLDLLDRPHHHQLVRQMRAGTAERAEGKPHMKAIAALVTVAIGAAIAGCGLNTGHAPQSATTRPLDPRSAGEFADSVAARATPASASITPGAPVRYRTIEYSADITNAGLPGAYTAF